MKSWRNLKIDLDPKMKLLVLYGKTLPNKKNLCGSVKLKWYLWEDRILDAF